MVAGIFETQRTYDLLLLFMLSSLLLLGVLFILARGKLKMPETTWWALSWTGVALTATDFLLHRQQHVTMLDIVRLPFTFSLWCLLLVPYFYLGNRLRRKLTRKERADSI
ncbi:MAG: hypothetical protein JXA57_06230 [Armatimonadetes bacterium]|nr:hypothetical protein [Armatimonadota bacterium]